MSLEILSRNKHSVTLAPKPSGVVIKKEHTIKLAQYFGVDGKDRIAELEAKLSELCEVSKSPCSDEIAIWVDNNTDEIKQLLGDK